LDDFEAAALERTHLDISCRSLSSKAISINFTSGPVMKKVRAFHGILVASPRSSTMTQHHKLGAARVTCAGVFKTSSGSRSRKRKRMTGVREFLPDVRDRRSRRILLGSSVTTECPPSQIPSLEG